MKITWRRTSLFSSTTTIQPPRAQISNSSFDEQRRFCPDELLLLSSLNISDIIKDLGQQKRCRKGRKTPFTKQYFVLRINGHQCKSKVRDTF